MEVEIRQKDVAGGTKLKKEDKTSDLTLRNHVKVSIPPGGRSN